MTRFDYHRSSPAVSARGAGRLLLPWESAVIWRDNKRFFAQRWRVRHRPDDLELAIICRENQQENTR